MGKTETAFSSPSLQQSPAERVLDLLFVSRSSSLTVGAFKYLRTILTGRSFMLNCQPATHEGGGKPADLPVRRAQPHPAGEARSAGLRGRARSGLPPGALV